jgi:hypothetical protein
VSFELDQSQQFALGDDDKVPILLGSIESGQFFPILLEDVGFRQSSLDEQVAANLNEAVKVLSARNRCPQPCVFLPRPRSLCQAL